MRLSWNEIRVRAARFAEEWRDAHYEKGETQTFYNEFFQIFGVTRRRVATFEEPVKRLEEKHGFIDLLWKGVLLVEQKSAGRDLIKAKEQALDYFPGLKEYELPRYLLVGDFQNFELYDLEERTALTFQLHELPSVVEHFSFILGVEKRRFRDQDPVNIKASELMGKLHDALEASGYRGDALELFLVRLLFCLFADDTGIFEPRDIFQELIEERTHDDGSDTGAWIGYIFETLNTPIKARQNTLDADLQRFPYVNGDLFAERLPLPAFNSQMRALLLEACAFSWDAISPAIFGALFQSVMNPQERRALGAHYTTEQNIMKVIQPLFLDGLWAEFEQIKARRDTSRRTVLIKFHKKLGSLRLFDPACGCGNFLVIAYRELRELELAVLRELIPKGQQSLFDVTQLSQIDVDQFYGIEISEFPARIAEVALWMMDHIMNNKLSLEFGEHFARIPLVTSPHIVNADALDMSWRELLPSSQCSYVLGNPPFIGAKYQTAEQRAQVRRIADLGGTGGTLDYVTAWFLMAAEYVQGTDVGIGFVATSSITQGEQVAQLWPRLLDNYALEIAFAHRTFAWGSDARGMAHVHVVIVGLAPRAHQPEKKRLFNYADIKGDPVESQHKILSPYLFDAERLANPHLVVRESSRPLCGAPKLISGTQPIDNGNYIFDEQARSEFLAEEPAAADLMRPYVGSYEYINGSERSILYLKEADPARLRRMSNVVARMRRVREYRSKSKRTSTLAIADYPERYNVEVVPDASFLCIPKVSSERRDYVPIGWLEPPTIPSDLVFVLNDADPWHFGILTSKMHMAWLKNIGGKLKSDYRYSIGIVYNTFPWPSATDTQRDKVRELANAVFHTRTRYPDATLADLYDPDTIPTPLRKAHAALDAAVDRLYGEARLDNDRQRAEVLMARYEALVNSDEAAEAS